MTSSERITILGAGVAGLSASYHFGHERCVVFERRPTWGGHARSERLLDCVFDQGPHVSFTKHQYVRDLFARGVNGEFRDFDVRTRNYYHGTWIDHPAQGHLWQIPEPLREECHRGLLAAAQTGRAAAPVDSYDAWLRASFGSAFTDAFPAAYTRKYWTADATRLSSDWVGQRVHRPTVAELEAAMRPGAAQSLHYITRVRYPQRGGFQSFLRELARGVQLRAGKEVAAVDLEARRIYFSDGDCHGYDRLVSTLPLTALVSRCVNVPGAVREAAAQLDCTQLLLIDVCPSHPAKVEGHWFYVYDEDKLATRIHFAERLSPENAPSGRTALQAEVYYSRHRPLQSRPGDVAAQVTEELVQMGLVDEAAHARGEVRAAWRWAPYANVMFTLVRREALDLVLNWLERFGLAREEGDLDPSTEWDRTVASPLAVGSLMLAGRFAQWKYYWTDDCVLRGRQLAGTGL